MIRDGDRIVLAPGVTVVPGGVRDAVRGCVLPVNGTGRFVLARAGELPLGSVAAELAARSRTEPELVRRDVRSFAAAVSAACLVNVEPGGGRRALLARWAAETARLLPLGRTGALPRARRRLDTGSLGSAARATARAGAGPAAAAAALAAGVAALTLAGLGGGSVAAAAVALGAATGLGLLAHELGHVLALRGVPAALLVSVLRVAVLHAPVPPRRRALVAAAGPSLPAAAGAALLGLGEGLPAVELSLAGIVLAAQAGGLTVAAPDGRAACGLS